MHVWPLWSRWRDRHAVCARPAYLSRVGTRYLVVVAVMPATCEARCSFVLRDTSPGGNGTTMRHQQQHPLAVLEEAQEALVNGGNVMDLASSLAAPVPSQWRPELSITCSSPHASAVVPDATPNCEVEQPVMAVIGGGSSCPSGPAPVVVESELHVSLLQPSHGPTSFLPQQPHASRHASALGWLCTWLALLALVHQILRSRV